MWSPVPWNANLRVCPSRGHDDTCITGREHIGAGDEAQSTNTGQ